MINNHGIFLTFLFGFVPSIISGTSWFDLFDKAYGHGISRDESLPFDISGRQIAVEGMLEPPFLNEGDQKPSLMIRTHDEKTNQTMTDINYRIIAKFKNETILDQQFHANDGIVSADLLPFNDSLSHEIITKVQAQPPLSKNDPVEVSLKNPVTLKSKLLADGGLYDISVILQKSSKGLKLESDKKVDLFISIGKNFPFIINEIPSKNSNSNNRDVINLTLTVKTFYDEIRDFVYNTDTSKISFKMPFTWNLDYVNQVVNLHNELVIPKSYTPLSKVSSFTGKLNGLEIPQNAILIDDFTDENNRIVHIVVANFKLKEFTNQIIKEGGNSYARFELKPMMN